MVSRAEREEAASLLSQLQRRHEAASRLAHEQQHEEQDGRMGQHPPGQLLNDNGNSSSDSDDDDGSSSSTGSWPDDDNGSGPDLRPSRSSRHASGDGGEGLLQPGVLALHVSGSMLATVDSSTGDVWLRDFSFGTPAEPPPLCAVQARVGMCGGGNEGSSKADGAGLGRFWA